MPIITVFTKDVVCANTGDWPMYMEPAKHNAVFTVNASLEHDLFAFGAVQSEVE